MGRDNDIAASLPRPPQPAPARREAAIAEALRRFDGGVGERPATTAAAGNRGSTEAPWRTRFGRPYAGALAGALLVALIALPLAWTTLPDQARDGPAASREQADKAGPVMAEADPAAPASAIAPPPLPGDRAADRFAAADAAPGGSEPAPVAKEDLRAGGRNEPALADASESDGVVVTGSRVAQPDLSSSSPVTSVGEESTIVVSGTRSSRSAPSRRGDWNACTIDDPARDLGACRRLVDPGAKGEAGRAAAQVADGLARAWEGDLEQAIAAFDRAIAIAPRSAFAYLNRGLAFRRSGELDRALADLDRAVRFAPRSARGYFHRSLLLHQRGDVARAQADEERAVALDPRYGVAIGR